jgi:hypothetical protein
MGGCSSCLSKCKNVKLVDCPFYEFDEYTKVKEALKDLQNTFWGGSYVRYAEYGTNIYSTGTSSTETYTFDGMDLHYYT